MTTKHCIVIAHSANLAGFLNNFSTGPNGEPKKYRIDYKQLLEYSLGDRKLINAFMVSQQDSTVVRSPESLLANQRFLQTLKKFGWDPIKVAFNSQTKEMTQIINTVWTAVSEEITNGDGDLVIDPSEIDIVFITGSQLWGDMINTFASYGFNVEVAYPKKSTSKILYSNFAFLDLTEFIIYSDNCIKNKTVTELVEVEVRKTPMGG